ncbi:MAG: helix-turn-helix transcriptional regulator [Chloroflexota bacterium]
MSEIKVKIREVIEAYQETFPPEERPTQLQIAVGAGISPTTLSSYMTGKVKRTELAVVAKLCKYLGIRDMNDLFEYVDDEEEEPNNE